MKLHHAPNTRNSKARVKIISRMELGNLEDAMNDFMTNLQYQIHNIEYFEYKNQIHAAIIYDEALPLGE